MLLAFAFSHRDGQAALKNAQWIADLGGVSRHRLLITCSQQAHREGFAKKVYEILKGSFSDISTHIPYDEVEIPWNSETRDASSPNHLFARTVCHVRDVLGDSPFLWHEGGDAIPLRSTWLDEYEAAYSACLKPFMGARVLLPNIPVHMTGNGVYHKLWQHAPDFQLIGGLAFDVALANHILGKFHETNLIQHEWRPAPFTCIADMDRITPAAAIYHQDKTGSLIDRMRERNRMTPPQVKHFEPPHPAVPRIETPRTAPVDADVLHRLESLEKQVALLTAGRGLLSSFRYRGETGESAALGFIRDHMELSKERAPEEPKKGRKPFTDEQKQAARERMAKARAAKKPKSMAGK